MGCAPGCWHGVLNAVLGTFGSGRVIRPSMYRHREKRALCVRATSNRPKDARSRIIHYRTYRTQETEDEFEEWARSEVALIPKAERLPGGTNEQLAGWRPRDVVLEDPRDFIMCCITLSALSPMQRQYSV